MILHAGTPAQDYPPKNEQDAYLAPAKALLVVLRGEQSLNNLYDAFEEAKKAYLESLLAAQARSQEFDQERAIATLLVRATNHMCALNTAHVMDNLSDMSTNRLRVISLLSSFWVLLEQETKPKA